MILQAPDAEEKKSFRHRQLGLLIGFLLLIFSLILWMGIWELPHCNLAPLAEQRLKATTGRMVSVGTLHVTLNRWLVVDLDDVHIANIPNGSRPDMVTLQHAHLEVRLMSLFRGPAELRNVVINGLAVFCEQTASGQQNWRFVPRREELHSVKSAADSADWRWFPGLRSVHVINSTFIFRTSSGKSYDSVLNDMLLASSGDEAPVRFVLNGTFNKVPFAVKSGFRSFAEFRRFREPFDLRATVTSGDLVLYLDTTVKDLRNFDGVDGKFDLATQTSKSLLAIAGLTSASLETPLVLKGHFIHKGNLWSLSDATGKIRGSTLAPTSLTFREGGKGKPDMLSGQLNFSMLDIDALLAGGTFDGTSAKFSRKMVKNREMSTASLATIRPNLRLDMSFFADHLRYRAIGLEKVGVTLKRTADGIDIRSTDLNLTSLAAPALTQTSGRRSTVGSLHVRIGPWVMVDLDDVHIANIPDGSRPDMFRLRHAHLELRLMSLLASPVELRNVRIDGFSGLFERTAKRERNWHFSPAPEEIRPVRQAAEAPDLNWFPGLRSVHITGSEIIYRSSNGKSYVSSLNDVVLSSVSDETPIRMTVVGAYNSVPLTLKIALHPFSAFRHAGQPFGMAFTATSGDLTMHLVGTATDLLNFDGINGTVDLITPSSWPLMRIAGIEPGSLKVPLRLRGHFIHLGDVWSLTQTGGNIRGSDLRPTDLVFREGAFHQPDAISGALNFSTLDMNALLAGAPPRKASDGAQVRSTEHETTDIPLFVDVHPDPLLDLSFSAEHILYNRFAFDNAALSLKRIPGEISIQRLGMAWLGATLQMSGTLRAKGDGTLAQASVAVANADIDRFRRQAGLPPLPLSGMVAFQGSAVSGPVKTLNQAVTEARIIAGAGITSGTLSRQVLGIAQENLALLFRRQKGSEPVSCLLAFVSMDHGRGALRPLRIRTSVGSFYGEANFDLGRKWFELVFTSHGARAPFALEIPLLARGSFSNPGFGLAMFSRRGRALLKDAASDIPVPVSLKDYYSHSPCLGEIP
ncbi:AsmA family protein [Acetobacter sp. AN02]|uniref:AsmA family protein n=1 Tax=Acetobacter sp. AN02 TaxID=2894186 RepID=UPI0024342865|nr:AsmA family protein [Acetobacter sp. AN02]MDG6095613.1 AsmA family protein [Acetobacter sp. AN02]